MCKYQMYTYAFIHMYANLHIYACTYMYIYIYKYVYIYIYIYVYNVGKTIIKQPFGHALYHLFMVILGMGFKLFYPH